MSHQESFVSIDTKTGQRIHGNLHIPENAKGLVLFAHGSGSSRFSPRNQLVAEHFHQSGLGTLLMDLLTEFEAEDRTKVFDIELLSSRLFNAADYLETAPEAEGLPLGLFGASTGGAAVLLAAAIAPERFGAVVSRGGRPDLAASFLDKVKVPTLFIVGEKDDLVLELNKRALKKLNCLKQLSIIPSATHLFEERGALEQVANLATKWFSNHLFSRSRRPTHVSR